MKITGLINVKGEIQAFCFQVHCLFHYTMLPSRRLPRSSIFLPLGDKAVTNLAVETERSDHFASLPKQVFMPFAMWFGHNTQTIFSSLNILEFAEEFSHLLRMGSKIKRGKTYLCLIQNSKSNKSFKALASFSHPL